MVACFTFSKGKESKNPQRLSLSPCLFPKDKNISPSNYIFINFYSSHYLWPFLTWANRKSQEYGCICGCIILISGFINSHHRLSPYINMSKRFCTFPTEKHASPKHSQIKDYSFVCPNDSVFNIICLLFFWCWYFGDKWSLLPKLWLYLFWFSLVFFFENRWS